MEESDSKDVPEEFFYHVTKSLDNGIQKGMLLEIKYKSDPDIYWIASITMVCGPLLRVRYIGSETDFWCDIVKMEVHPLGWCRHFEGIIEPPDDISDRHGDNIVTLMKDMVTNGATVPNESLISNGSTVIERIKFGMKLEVQSVKDPYKFWIATIIENIGGRLLLRYDAPEDVFEEFWIFYTDHRLRPVGFAKSKGPPFQLYHPENSQNVTFDESEWESCLMSSVEDSQEYPFPNEVLVDVPKPLFHQFESGMKLEALNPSNMSDISPATVTQIFDNFYFLVVLDDYLNDANNDGGYWLCNIDHPYIFPVGWAKSNGIKIVPPISWNKKKEFDWNEYLIIKSSNSAFSRYFKKPTDSSEIGYAEEMNLEVVDPLNPMNICSASIIKMTKHLLHIYIKSTKNKHWFYYENLTMFPTGWCSSNNHPLEKPDFGRTTTSEKISSNTLQSKSKEEWCDKIFFNYKCYSGPFISRNKLSQLPKSVGPGPLFLVIREVLNMIISVAYKPAKLLKDWEHEGKVDQGKRIEMLKAKLKTSTYHANVLIASSNDETMMYCKEMCTKLQACPYLFGPQEYSEQCPERCLQVDKAKFHNIVATDKRGRPKGSISKSSVPKCWNTSKKRKKRGLHFMTIRARERRAALESSGNKEGAESGNESDPSPCSTPQQSEAGTRPNSPDSNSDTATKKQRKKREPRANIPPLEMKTRGAKLPNFAIQMKEGHWDKKDVQTIYNNTCVVPKKPYLDDSESEDNSSTSNSLDIKHEDGEIISDVSDSEEPELKKLRVTPLHDPQPTDVKMFHCNTNGSVSNLSVGSAQNKNNLSSNPRDWSVTDLYSHLIKYEECKEIAEKLKEEEIDGAAFIMLNFPTMCQHLQMRMKPALNLCKHVASLKWSFISRYVNVNCDG